METESPRWHRCPNVSFQEAPRSLKQLLFSVLVEMYNDNDTAMMQVRSLFVSDPDHWANALWVALETRFTQETLSQLQNNLIHLRKFTADLSNESFKQMIGRFRKLISEACARSTRHKCRRTLIYWQY